MKQKQLRGIKVIGAAAAADEMQNNFGEYLNIVIGGKEVIVTQNGRVCGYDRTNET